MDKIIKDYLKTLGYGNEVIDSNQESRVATYLDWYKGKTKFHKINIYNGKKYVTYEMKTLNIANKSCGDLSDFFFNEKLDITIDNEKVQKQIKDCLDQNHFLFNANKLMQLVEALGTGAFVPYLDEGVLRINFIKATNIIILKTREDEVIDVCFWSKTINDGKIEYLINTHILTENGYVIKNVDRIKGKSGDFTDKDLGNMAEIKTESFIPRFGMLFTPIVNNADINSPYGISIYANATDNILSIDRAYDSLDNEINIGKKRVYVKSGATKFNIDEEGNATPAFDPSDIAYYEMPGEDGDKMLTESSFDLRIGEITDALQAQLNLYTSTIGLGHNYYKFKNGEVYVNTDNVISANSDVYRKIKKQENIITYALQNLIYAIAELTGVQDTFTISIDYDDSIIEDTEKTQKQAQSEYNSKLISKAQYYRDVYKLKDDSAKKFAEQMNQEILEETITDGTEQALEE